MNEEITIGHFVQLHIATPEQQRELRELLDYAEAATDKFLGEISEDDNAS